MKLLERLFSLLCCVLAYLFYFFFRVGGRLRLFMLIFIYVFFLTQVKGYVLKYSYEKSVWLKPTFQCL